MKARYLFVLFFILLAIGTIYSLPQNIVAKQKTILCGEEITRNTILTQDLICGNNGLIIDANDIVLDCNNHSIFAISLQGHFASGNGITIENKQGIIIRNCKINGYQYGIYLNNSRYNSIYGNILDNNINAYETESSYLNEWDQNSWESGNGWFDLEENSSYPNYYEIAGPGNGRDNYPIPTNPNNILELPIASQVSGNVDYLSAVTLNSSIPQTIIRYTLNGIEPNEYSLIYSEPIIISESLTLKAKAYKRGHFTSQTANYSYIVQTVSAPTASQESGDVNYNSLVTLSTTTPQATIKYTLDGTEPNESSLIYSNPIVIDQNLTIKAKAYRQGYIPSQVVTYNYSVNLPPIQIVCGNTIDSNVILTEDINCGQDQWVALTVNSNNITIDCNGHTISGSPGIDDWGINIMGRSGITITNCIFTNLNFPIYHEDGSNNQIINNLFWYTRHGPILRKGSNNLIRDNNIIGAEMDGIGVIGYLNDGIPSSDNNVINNQVINCGSDYASVDLSYAHGTIVRDNNIYATGQYDSSGIMINAVSANNLVEHNLINNGDYGIWITTGSNNNLIRNNKIMNSLYNGLYLDSEIYNNTVTNNDFINNASQAYQEANQTNVWSQDGIGNYWSNHNCIDENAPIGICDNPFYLPGGQDNFPLVNPVWNNRDTPNLGQTKVKKEVAVSKSKPLILPKENNYKINKTR